MDDANSVYVGGLSYESNEDAVRKAFMEFGDVASVKIVYDRESGESRGFGFVSFVNSRSAHLAIRDMDGGQVDGRTIRVNEVRKNMKGGLGFRDRDHRDFPRFRDMRERLPRRGRDSPPPRMHRRTRSPPLHRHMSRSLTPMRISPPPARGSSPRSSRYHHHSSPDLHLQQQQQRKDRSRSARSSISPQSSERKQEESVHKEAKEEQPQQQREEDDEEVRRLREELDKVLENRRGLEEKVASLQGVVEKADVTIAALKTKSLKLEESLANSQQLAAQRQFQLKRLQTSVFHFKLATERLTNSEKEMKALAALTSLELDHDHPREQLANGHAPAPEEQQQQNHATTTSQA